MISFRGWCQENGVPKLGFDKWGAVLIHPWGLEAAWGTVLWDKPRLIRACARSLNEIQKSDTQLDTEHMAVDQSWEETKSGSQRCEAKSDRRNPVSYNRLILQSHALRLHFKFLGLRRQGQGWPKCVNIYVLPLFMIYTPRPVPPRALSYHQLFRVSLGVV